jgi:hypothetical protein
MVSQIFNHYRNHGYKNDRDDYQRKIAFHGGQISKIVPPENENGNPGNTANNIVKEKA